MEGREYTCLYIYTDKNLFVKGLVEWGFMAQICIRDMLQQYLLKDGKFIKLSNE